MFGNQHLKDIRDAQFFCVTVGNGRVTQIRRSRNQESEAPLPYLSLMLLGGFSGPPWKGALNKMI